MKLVVDIDIPYLNGVFEPFFDEVVYRKGNEIVPADLKDAQALIIRTRTKCDAQLLRGSGVRIIATATIGTDHIDLDYCSEHGIEVFSAQGCNKGGVLQWVLSAMVNLFDESSVDFRGKVIGVVGVGNIGRLVVNAAKALGIEVLQCDPPRERVEGGSQFFTLQTIAKESDIITLHVPLTHSGKDATLYLANSNFFRLVKPNALIINSSRGGVIDEKALLAIMASKRLRVALDVWENEPLISIQMLGKSAVATPHVAGYSLEGKVNASAMVVNAVSKYFNLGICNWFPNPNPIEQKVYLDIDKYIDNKDFNIKSLVNSIYSITHDDLLLRQTPYNFEQLRNSYTFRRENSGHVISSENRLSNFNQLSDLGFSTQ